MSADSEVKSFYVYGVGPQQLIYFQSITPKFGLNKGLRADFWPLFSTYRFITYLSVYESFSFWIILFLAFIPNFDLKHFINS